MLRWRWCGTIGDIEITEVVGGFSVLDGKISAHQSEVER